MNPNQPPLILRDIHLPEPVSWWPLAPGWWIILALIIITSALTFVFLRRYRQRHYRRLGLQKLTAIELDLATHQDQQQLVQQLSQLLRHMAVLHYGPHCAGLDGNGWLSFLDQSFEKKGAPLDHPHQPFSKGVGHCLAAGPYQKIITDIDTTTLFTLCRLWIKRLPLATRRCA